MKTGFHHVGLKVKDFDKTVKFYKEVLGLQEKLAWKMGDDDAIMLTMSDGGILEIFSGGTDSDEANARWSHFAIAVDDVPGTYKKAVDFGAKPRTEPGKTAIDGKLNIEYAFVYGFGGEVLEFFKEV